MIKPQCAGAYSRCERPGRTRPAVMWPWKYKFSKMSSLGHHAFEGLRGRSGMNRAWWELALGPGERGQGPGRKEQEGCVCVALQGRRGA